MVAGSGRRGQACIRLTAFALNAMMLGSLSMMPYAPTGSSRCRSGHHIDTSSKARYTWAHKPHIDAILTNQPVLESIVWAAMETTGMSAEITSKDTATTQAINQVEPDRFLLHVRPVIELTDDQLFELCQINQELWIERTAEGDLVIMPPEGGETNSRGGCGQTAAIMAIQRYT